MAGIGKLQLPTNTIQPEDDVMPFFQMAQSYSTPYAPFINPNPIAYREPSVLSTDARQQQLGSAYDKVMGDIVNGGSKADRYEDAATRIFSQTIAPAMAAFGGPGTSDAGVALMQQTRSDVMAAKQRRLVEQQNSLSAIKAMTDIANVTSLKPFGQMLRDFRKGQELDIKRANNEATIKLKERVATSKEDFNTMMGDHLTRADQLKALGLQLGYHKLQQARDLAGQNDQRIRDIARLNAQERLYGTNTQLQMQKDRLIKEYQTATATVQTNVNKFNSEIEAKLSERDTKGNFKHLDASGKPLDASQFKLNFGGFDQSISDEPDDADYQQALQDVSGSGATRQAPQAPAAIGQLSGQQLALQSPAKQLVITDLFGSAFKPS